MRVLRKGLSGEDVRQWELFLHGRGFTFTKDRDEIFDAETDKLTKDFQKKNKLKDDGIVGNATFGVAMQQGFEAVPFVDEPESKFPAEPNFDPIVGNSARDIIFGPLRFRPGPSNGGFGKETITITNNFESAKIARVNVPEVIGIPGGPSSGKMRFHTSGAVQLAALWEAWGRKNLRKLILTFDGAFAPRFIRCSSTALSNHAFGTAFDINADQNPLGAQPALPGQKGCVFQLVPIAHRFGFYWGGHFSRRDGMHFEIAKLMSASDVERVLARF